MNYKHGQTWKGGAARVYRAWRSMHDRCYLKSNPSYSRYGGRGITVCPRWHSFTEFLTDMGHPPTNKSLGRIDNDGDYKPSNCRWETHIEQDNNKRTNVFLTFRNKKLTIQQWSRTTGIKFVTLHARIFRYGWTIERALTTSVRVLTPRKRGN